MWIMDKVRNHGTLYIVATPIGNLEDITLRALRVLREVDLIVCEDTRVTKKLLARYEINKPTLSYFQHSKVSRVEKIMEELAAGKDVALVTDAGTPGISDPGNVIVAEAVKRGINAVAVPGPSALTAIACLSGVNMQKFLFLAFPPNKKGRKKFFAEIAASKYPVIYYESPHRLMKNLKMLVELCPSKGMAAGRELTKVFEEVVRGSVAEVYEFFSKHPEKVRGEFAIVVYQPKRKNS